MIISFQVLLDICVNGTVTCTLWGDGLRFFFVLSLLADNGFLELN